ncbi:MAG: glycoside hydrolase family 2, partial [Chloroflexi bacterium]|nr:glycoside hydrolase family 2 [Chloroflexota bacterium]
WLFYASTEMNPRNPIWRDVPALNSYIARVQAVLQEGSPANDVLLYWPIYDVWHSDQGLNINMTVHHRDWFEKFPVAALAGKLWQNGWTFDFISDRQLAACRPDGVNVKTAGGTRYRAIVVPATIHMPVATAEKLAALAKAGVKVIYDSSLPADVPGLQNLDTRRAALKSALSAAQPAPDVEAALRTTRSQPEPMTPTHGLEFVRRSNATGRWYFITNRTSKPIDDFVELGVPAPGVLILDPLTGRSGAAALRRQGRLSAVRLQLEPGASIILRTLDRYASGPRWQYTNATGDPVSITSPWSVTFLAGGPQLPPPYETKELRPWSAQGPAYEVFGGTAVYKTNFEVPAAGNYLLDLGQVAQSARVRLNGKDLGTVWCAPFRLTAEGVQLNNTLEIEVTSTAANRIRDLDRRKVLWKNFYDINFVNMDYKPFDASNWPLAPSGLQGPVQLTRLSAPAAAAPARKAPARPAK